MPNQPSWFPQASCPSQCHLRFVAPELSVGTSTKQQSWGVRNLCAYTCDHSWATSSLVRLLRQNTSLTLAIVLCWPIKSTSKVARQPLRSHQSRLCRFGTSGSLDRDRQQFAWGWQQGCMLQRSGKPDVRSCGMIVQDDRFVCHLYDLDTASSAPSIAPSTHLARMVDWSVRLTSVAQITRPGYGYEGVEDPNVAEHAPAGDGIWKVDLATARVN